MVTDSQRIHLINPLANAFGGSEWRTLETYRLLSPHAEVEVWSGGKPDPRLPSDVPWKVIGETPDAFPRDGCMVFIGCYQPVGAWVCRSRAQRTVIVCNTHQPDALARMALSLSWLRSPIEMVYASTWLAESVGILGDVQQSPVDLSRFAIDRPLRRIDAPFRVGRMSRDTPAKHHGPDAELYRAMVGAGCEVRLMGGTFFHETLGGSDGVKLMPAGAMPAHDFLRSIDCFYYRTHDRWKEPAGRVIMEAMASGLPVVAHRRGGYADWIEHGRSGFLFDEAAEALQIIQSLRANPGRCAEVGDAARRAVEKLYGEKEQQRIIAFFTRPTGPSS